MIKNKVLNKILKSALVILILACALFVLNRNASNARKTTSYLPKVSDTPVYVEMERDVPLSITISISEDMPVSALELFLVNISADSKGSFSYSLKDKDNNIIQNGISPISDLKSGEYSQISFETMLYADEKYELTLCADGSEPYFMLLDGDAHKGFPFSVILEDMDGESLSLGFDTAKEVTLKFGDILYFSIPFCILLSLCLLIYIWTEGAVLKKLSNIPIKPFFEKYGLDLFLILEAVTLILGIYYRAYVNNIFITSDSSNYLREATNIIKGNGFSYDGLAGYKSWFASWPILYPLMIALVMLITGTEAYLASKILSMIIIVSLLVIFRVLFKKDAWIYGLILLNSGFVEISHYTWSEMPFFIFIMMYGYVLSRIIRRDKSPIKDYILLSVMALASFLTRYYGLFVFFVAGIYILILFKQYLKEKDKQLFKKIAGLVISSFLSGVLCICYLLLNRIKNGYASGVSRTLWWDDYEILTNDLIFSLLKEFFNIFSLKIPSLIEGFSYPVKLWVVWLIIIGMIILIRKPVKGFDVDGIWIVMGIVYYVMFVAIRYMSSMDTFYFRFFLPGTFLICLGVFNYLVKTVRYLRIKSVILISISVLLILDIFSLTNSIISEKNENYYDSITQTWEKDYSQIPNRSVVIFSTLDFRSIYYRPDVVGGAIDPSNTMEDIKNTYYGSDNMVILRNDAVAMVAEPLYQQDVEAAIVNALENTPEENKYIVIGLN